MASFPNPLIPGFNPDPSIVRVGADYYLVTSSFEYLPGLPVYHSTDLSEWQLVGAVATRDEQLGIQNVPSFGGAWAPTIRYRDGLFFVIVSVAEARGCVVFTAEDPAGPWSDGVLIDGINGIDPDLAWDDEGTAYVTYSGFSTSDSSDETHAGILQVVVDLATGRMLSEPTRLWSGTGMKFPEAPHLYHRDGYWYLMIAEGGTERGHSVSIARGDAPSGPFEGAPGNPVLSARSTSRPIQNTGHADLVDTPDGGSAFVVLGMRPRGLTQAFSALGRETFITPVRWKDGWPVAEPVELHPRPGETTYRSDFAAGPLDLGWVGVRQLPATIGSLEARPGWLVIEGDGSTLDDLRPRFVGRRQVNQTARIQVTVDAGAGTGGLGLRYDEEHHVELEATSEGDTTRVRGRLRLGTIEQTWSGTLPAGPVVLTLDDVPVPGTFGVVPQSSDRITLRASAAGEEVLLGEVDGRYLSAEAAASFTGRIYGLYAAEGTVAFRDLEYTGSED